MSAPSLALALRQSATVVSRVAAGRSLSAELEREAEAPTETRAALIDLTHGTLRRYGRVQAIVRALSRQKSAADPGVEALLWCSLYALESGRYAPYTVVDQAVRACGLMQKWPAKGYVNGLLRAYLRSREAVEARVAADDPQARYQHPAWWIDLVRDAYPENWQAVLLAGNSHPPMGLRVNARRITLDAYLERLKQAGIGGRPVGGPAVVLERPVPLERLPGFAAGEVSVQDAGAQRAARCLELADGQRVLDACAAPGGKSGHILETAAVELTALDVDPARCARIRANLDRLGLSARIVAADCTRPEAWWDGRPFDRILADVPCSASGIVRRHPDVKWLRRPTDLAAFAARQSDILAALWQALAPGGKLLYVTCSVFPAENEAVIARWLACTPDARRVPLADGGPSQGVPGDEHDGFFHALIQKNA